MDIGEVIIEEAKKIDTTFANYLVCLEKFKVAGFEKLSMFLDVRDLLTKHEILFHCNRDKMLIWLDNLEEGTKNILDKKRKR